MSFSALCSPGDVTGLGASSEFLFAVTAFHEHILVDLVAVETLPVLVVDTGSAGTFNTKLSVINRFIRKLLIALFRVNIYLILVSAI